MANRLIGVSHMAAALVAMNQFRAPTTTPPAGPTISNQILNANIARAQTISQSPILARVNQFNNPSWVPSPFFPVDEEDLSEYPRLWMDRMQLAAEKSEARLDAYNMREKARLQRLEKCSIDSYSMESAKTPHLLALKKRVARIEPREVRRLATRVHRESQVLTPDVNNICGLLSGFSFDPSSAATPATIVQSTPVHTTPVQSTPVQGTPVKHGPVVKSPTRRRGVASNPLVIYHRYVSDGLKRLSARVGVPLVASIAISSKTFRALSTSSNLGSTRLELSRISTRSTPSSWLDGGNFFVTQEAVPSAHNFRFS